MHLERVKMAGQNGLFSKYWYTKRSLVHKLDSTFPLANFESTTTVYLGTVLENIDSKYFLTKIRGL